MSLDIVAFIFGGFLIAAGVFGSGLEIKELKLPQIGKVSRILAALSGFAFIILALAINQKWFQPLDAFSKTPSAELEAKCDIYAQSAVKDFEKLNKSSNLDCHITNPRWHASYQNHYVWCLSTTDVALKNEEFERKTFLESCADSDKPAVTVLAEPIPVKAENKEKPLQPIEPCQFISKYYEAYNNKDISASWKMISRHAKEESDPLLTESQRFEQYSDKANLYESTTFQDDCEVEASNNPDEITVKGTVIYKKYSDKKPILRPYAHGLVKNGQSWLINSHPSNKRKK